MNPELITVVDRKALGGVEVPALLDNLEERPKNMFVMEQTRATNLKTSIGHREGRRD